MPYSFTQIEKDKSRSIVFAFGFLCFLYFATAWGVLLFIKNYPYFEGLYNLEPVEFHHFTLMEIGLILSSALILAVTHWLFTINGLTERITRILNALPPDPVDPAQAMFTNIIEEVRAATGGLPIKGLVMPAMALNACAYSDGHSVPVIAVTKGLIYKLSRAQLEGVVAHEAAHVVSKDSDNATIISSMFEPLAAGFSGIRIFFESLTDPDNDNRWDSYRHRPRVRIRMPRGRGGAFLLIFILFIIILLGCVNILATLMRMFISREREYRADAVAARLTRYPLGLAEALYIIDSKRHSPLDAIEELETIFIVNPSRNSRDDQVNFLVDLWSTHPPLDERIKVLLSMAHGTEEDLQKVLMEFNSREEEVHKPQAESHAGLWMAKNQHGAWLGPFALTQLADFEWATPETIVKPVGEEKLMPFNQVGAFIKKADQKSHEDVTLICPACRAQLELINYENESVLKCRQCEGILLEQDQLSPILHWKSNSFDTRIKAMAQAVLDEPKIYNDQMLSFQESDRTYRCAQCKAFPTPPKWRKCLFNRYYHVEVDKCLVCYKSWFDKDELEVMQCIFEKRAEQEQV